MSYPSVSEKYEIHRQLVGATHAYVEAALESGFIGRVADNLTMANQSIDALYSKADADV